VRTALGVSAYVGANALVAVLLDDAGDAWLVSTAVIHVAVAWAVRRPHALLLPLTFIAVLALVDKLVIRSNGQGDCHDWCGDMALWGGFVVFWLPVALLASTGTLVALWSARVLRNALS
jgi:hypothetical protein